MRKDIEMKIGGRKQWVAPELLVIKAGSAESSGGQNIPDGGSALNARS